MKLENVELTQESLTGYDAEAGVLVEVQCTLSYLNTKHVYRDTGQIVYRPITWKDTVWYKKIADALLDKDFEAMSEIHVRFGWIAVKANQLEFVLLSELVKKYHQKQLNGTEKSKLTAICRQLDISMKKMSAVYFPKPKKNEGTWQPLLPTLLSKRTKGVRHS